MPISFPVAKHPAQPYSFLQGRDGYTAEEVLSMACKDPSKAAGEILQFSLGDAKVSGRNTTTKIRKLVPHQNGFVATVLEAYTHDRALVLRPDDVWLAILSQFNFFVTARAEVLRAAFVAHEGKRELVVVVNEEGVNRYNVDFGDLANQMTGLVEKNVVDPGLRAWAMPDFTTTTANDTTVGAVLLMATLKEYFSYKIMLCGCGIPRVTLEGERADWIKILQRLEKLKEYGLETTAWYHLLRPVVARFVAAFDAPASTENVDFWQRVAHYTPGGSGRGNYYTGWITAFTVFSKKGKWMGNYLDPTRADPAIDPSTLTASTFWSTYTDRSRAPYRPEWATDLDGELLLDGTPYHQLYGRDSAPPAYGEVDVKLNDNGEILDCVMVAGSVGTRVASSGDTGLSVGGRDDTLGCVVGWWMFVKDSEKGNNWEKEKKAEAERKGAWW